MVALASGGEAARWGRKDSAASAHRCCCCCCSEFFMSASVLRRMQKERRRRESEAGGKREQDTLAGIFQSNAAAFNNLYTCGETQMLQVVVIQEGDLPINREVVWEYQRRAVGLWDC